ncbi:MAG: 2-amino-4-hydroxy-6-hydroxymethyldihydropteridine diphosphokinase [Kiritimatiellae bacterium]|nr:2-amino-4-hydroxy-6-hydroxymethyldihydropteridine diphosphokinase [Kiritimatiellia bacterium]
METIVSMGSNLGDRLTALTMARRRIAEWPDVRIAAQSPVYETEPVGVLEKYSHLRFLNAVLVLESPWDGHGWYKRLHALEAKLGRKRGLDRFMPRTIDLDIVCVGNTSCQSGGLVIPHPHWKERRFVVQPLADIRPDLVIPGETRTVRQVLEALPPEPKVALFAKEW